MKDVADHGAGRRGDDADHLREERQLALARRIEQPFSRKRLAAALEQSQQRALARELHPLDDDLILRPTRISRKLARRDDLGAILRTKGQSARAAAPDYRVDARILVLEGEVTVA